MNGDLSFPYLNILSPVGLRQNILHPAKWEKCHLDKWRVFGTTKGVLFHLSIYPSTHSSIYPCIHPSTHPFTLYPSLYPFLYPSPTLRSLNKWKEHNVHALAHVLGHTYSRKHRCAHYMDTNKHTHTHTVSNHILFVTQPSLTSEDTESVISISPPSVLYEFSQLRFTHTHTHIYTHTHSTHVRKHPLVPLPLIM